MGAVTPKKRSKTERVPDERCSSGTLLICPIKVSGIQGDIRKDAGRGCIRSTSDNVVHTPRRRGSQCIHGRISGVFLHPFR